MSGKRKWIWMLILSCALGPGKALAQQDPMFTKYMFNTLVYNPGFAGNQGSLVGHAVFRQQWIGIEDAPRTLALTVHTPTQNDRVGVGLTLMSDQAGALSEQTARLVYAYRIQMETVTLSVGMQVGLSNLRHDWSGLTLYADGDVVFSENRISQWLPNFGMGIYLRHPRFYVGLSMPELVPQDIGGAGGLSRSLSHVYLGAGGMIPVSDSWEFKPSLLVRGIMPSDQAALAANEQIQYGAPLELDIDLSLLYDDLFWVGASVRTAFLALTGNGSSYDSFDIWAAFYLDNGLRLGLAYDYPINRLSQVTGGSLELMVGYEWKRKRDRVVMPRYF